MGIKRVDKNKIEIRTPINNIDIIIGKKNEVYYFKTIGGKLNKSNAKNGIIFMKRAEENTESREHLYDVLIDYLYQYKIDMSSGYMETLITLGILFEKETWGKNE